MWVFIYGLIVIYIYALIGFAFYRELFDPTEGLYCTTVYECTMTFIHRGFIKGIIEVGKSLGLVPVMVVVVMVVVCVVFYMKCLCCHAHSHCVGTLVVIGVVLCCTLFSLLYEKRT